MIQKIISGGQTGADRAALDAAIRHQVPHGGWCPRDRKAEDGCIGGQYQLKETESSDYRVRTTRNVRHSDGTVVFTLGPVAKGGSLLTIRTAEKLRKPCLHISRTGGTYEDPAVKLQRFVAANRISVLNVAGSRESKEPGIYTWVWDVIEDAFFFGRRFPDLLGGPGEG